jgi:nicotinamide-nucleotide adenylyltransferase
LGHLALIRHLRERTPSETLLLGIGSAQVAYTVDNPFTAGERFEMLEAALEEARLTGCRPVPVTDVDRHAIWVAHVESILPRFTTVYTNNPLTRSLFERAGHPVVEPGLIERERFEGVKVRRAIAEDHGWRELVPPSVAGILDGLGAPERLRLLSGGHPRLARETRH